MKINLETLKKNVITKALKKELVMITLLDTGSNKKKIETKRKPLNISYVVDVSVSMDDKIATAEYKEYEAKIIQRQKDIADFYREYNQQKRVPQEYPPAPIYPDYTLNNFVNGIDNARVNIDNYWKFNQNPLPPHLTIHIPMPQLVSKLMQAKKALKEAVNSMIDGDIVSIVLFANNAEVLVEPTEISNETKKMMLSKIDMIHTMGATNLYAGWHLGALQVSKNFSKEKINRVELLTDGEISAGERNTETICSNVSKLLEAGIGVSTFGFGDRFNEVLLEGMSVAGNGNFYYVTETTNLSDIFMVEFDDIKNTAAQQIELSFETKDGVTLKNITSAVLKEKSPGVYLIPNIRFNTSRAVLFELNFDWDILGKEKSSKKSVNEIHNAIVINMKYLDNNGETVNVSKEFGLTVVSDKVYQKSEENNEIKIQKALIDVAENQRKAMEEMQKGNLVGATTIMQDSLSFARGFGESDARLVGASQTLTASLNSMSDPSSHESIKKSLYFSSYKGLRGDN